MKTFKRTLGALVGAGLLVAAVTVGAQAQTDPAPDVESSSGNAPWYPSLQAFEHYNSARSHVFPKATFGGSFDKPNRVELLRSSDGAYPSGYNMSYLNKDAAFPRGAATATSRTRSGRSSRR